MYKLNNNTESTSSAEQREIQLDSWSTHEVCVVHEDLVFHLIDKISQCEIVPQSGVERFGVTLNTPGEDTTEEIVHFKDQSPAFDYAVDSEMDSTRMISDTRDDNLENFFSRPIKVADYLWSTSGAVPLYETFNPWDLFFSNPRIINRISNYNLLRAKLHVKIILNGNAFYYGRAIASYQPLHTVDNVTRNRALYAEDLIGASQRPHVYLDPTTSTGGSLTLPFFWYKNYLSVPNMDWKSMGQVNIREMNPLAHANNSVESTVTVSVFVWASEVHLAVPTQYNPGDITPQSGMEDEYGQGVISKPASVLQRIAGKLTSAPIIGPYARATTIAAGAVAGVAKIFGYSRPVVLEPPKAYVPTYVGNLASTAIDDSCIRLTVDPKQEVTIDPRVTGLSSADELVITDLAKRESYLSTFVWQVGTESPVESLLYSMLVDPATHRNVNTGSLEHHLTPAGFAVMPFKYWRGSMEVRFQVVCSKFHRGRLKVVYDPYAGTSDAEYNTAYTYIVDIAECKDFTVKVGWGQPDMFREHCQLGFANEAMTRTGTPISWTATQRHGNGVLQVFVVNELTAPTNIANDIEINVFTNMCDDFTVACPTDEHLERATYLDPTLAVPQSGIEETETAPETAAPMSMQVDETMASGSSPTDHTLSVFFGEDIKSFRTLLKRYNHHEALPSDPLQTANVGVWNIFRYAFPFYRGYQTDGLYALPSGDYNYAQMTLMNWLTPAYGGRRGSTRWKTAFNGVTAEATSHNGLIRVRRSDATSGGASDLLRPYSGTTKAALAKEMRDATYSSGICGTSAQIDNLNPVLEFEIPYYSKNRFLPARFLNFVSSHPAWDFPKYVTEIFVNRDNSLKCDTFVAAGEDFSLYFFLGAPIVWEQIPPDAA